MRKQIARALIEVGFIVFLFYANLLMGEYTRSGHYRQHGPKLSLAWAVRDIFTSENLAIALGAAIIGYFVFEYLRRKL